MDSELFVLMELLRRQKCPMLQEVLMLLPPLAKD